MRRARAAADAAAMRSSSCNKSSTIRRASLHKCHDTHKLIKHQLSTVRMHPLEHDHCTGRMA